MRSVISIYVDNQYGVLARVSELFMRRGFNIDSLTVSETEDPNYSRITITTNGDEYIRDQLINQLGKLQNGQNTVEREIMLIKIRNNPENRSEIMAASEIFRAKIIDYTTHAICVEVTGEPSKIKAFIEIMSPLGIIEMCRTGVIALDRG